MQSHITLWAAVLNQALADAAKGDTNSYLWLCFEGFELVQDLGISTSVLMRFLRQPYEPNTKATMLRILQH